MQTEIPKVSGRFEFSIKDVHGLSEDEARDVLKKSESKYQYSSGAHHIDYVNGIPVKWDSIIKNDRYLLYVNAYDFRHGNYKAFDVLYKTFMHDEFSIARKGYGTYIVNGEKPEKDEDFSKERKVKYSAILKNTTRIVMPYGIRWFIQKSN